MNFLTIGVMIRKIKYMSILSVLLLYGCPDSDRPEYVSFGIENKTNSEIKISIHDRSTKNLIRGFGLPTLPSDLIIFSLTEANLGSSLGDYVPLESSGDSAVIVLNDRYLIHKYSQQGGVFTPEQKNIFRISSYTQESVSVYDMKLTQEDYENATPCNNDPICGD